MKNKTIRLICLASVLLGSLSQAECRADPIVVPTMAALRALSVSGLTNDTVALMIDYYQPSEVFNIYGLLVRGRGGGFFRWRTNFTEADDGGHYIAPTVNTTPPGRWERVLMGETANVRMWGAKADGTTDDAPAIQAAVNACGWICELLFPSGSYLVSNTIVFPGQLHIRGEGPVNNTFVQMPVGLQKDIFQTTFAHNALKGGLYISGTGFPLLYNGQGENVDYDHGLLFENISLSFIDPSGETVSTNAALAVCMPGETSAIRNVFTDNGGYGIRCLGPGTPGLKLYNVSTFHVTYAGVCIEGLLLANGSLAPNSSGGPVSLTGLSGDSFSSNKAPTASLLKITNCDPIVAVYEFKAEGEFGGGLFQYRVTDDLAAGQAFGSLTIHGGTWNASATYGSPHDVVVLRGLYRTAALNIDGGLGLCNTRYLIRDEVVGRNVESDVQIYNNSQLACRLPVHYESFNVGQNSLTNTSRLIRGQTAYSYLYATNGGWYRVMWPLGLGQSHIAGNLTVSLPGSESVEIQVDVGESGSPSLNVLHPPYGSGAVVTEVRAFRYPEPERGGNQWGAVDIHIGNPLTGFAYRIQEKRLTITHDLNGMEVFDSAQIQLIGQPFLVSDTLPTGAVSVSANTYR